jgi:hypothetical protein
VHTKQRVAKHHKVHDMTALTSDQLISSRVSSCPNHPDRDSEVFSRDDKQAMCAFCYVSKQCKYRSDVKVLRHASAECQESLKQRVAGWLPIFDSSTPHALS